MSNKPPSYWIAAPPALILLQVALGFIAAMALT